MMKSISQLNLVRITLTHTEPVKEEKKRKRKEIYSLVMPSAMMSDILQQEDRIRILM